MKIYTKTGDAGETGLFGGGRAAKDDARIEACGAVDELNAALGWAALGAAEAVVGNIREVQSALFDLGAELATPNIDPKRHAWLIGDERVESLEQQIDVLEALLPPLRHFILPGGTELAARLHVARTAARRAERRIVSLHRQAPLRPVVLRYVNRLSDLLFMMARKANHDLGVEDVPYRADTKS